MHVLMERLIKGDRYQTHPEDGKPRNRYCTSLVFHWRMLPVYWCSSRMAVKGLYDGEQWALSSLEVFRLLESAGVRFELENLEVPYGLPGPCVYVANHMSTLETLVLPCLVQPAGNTTFIVKEALTRFPVFGHVMRSRDPITVGRTDPREDLKAVLQGGKERIENGTSIIVFPQTTRSSIFDPAQFNTIGVKLARRAGVPVIPIALKTDAWENGRLLKDFGPIHPERKVHISFGEPMEVTDSGRETHERVIEFIQDKLEQWKNG
jgi:1-acyl-sn-glycerol-3-phosphate acyltransferase